MLFIQTPKAAKGGLTACLIKPNDKEFVLIAYFIERNTVNSSEPINLTIEKDIIYWNLENEN